MPSPRGTNHAGLFITANPRGAYDAALPESVGAELHAFLQGKLSEEDLAEFCKLAGIDAGLGMDEPEPFNGRPTPGGKPLGEDAARRRPAGLSGRALAHLRSIKVNP